jgi:hypothetical protein
MCLSCHVVTVDHSKWGFWSTQSNTRCWLTCLSCHVVTVDWVEVGSVIYNIFPESMQSDMPCCHVNVMYWMACHAVMSRCYNDVLIGLTCLSCHAVIVMAPVLTQG